MPKLDPSSDDFRAAGHRLVDWVADYLERVDDYSVLSRAKPGEIAAQFAPVASSDSRPYDALIEDFESKIMPGITHWNHPAFFAYFSITGSQAGILAELLTAALNANGMLWKTSPALTELETVTLEWLRKSLGLPEGLFGIINDTASINSFLALAAAREALGLDIRGKGMTGRDLPPLKVYCSEQAHSSIEKGALALGFGVRGVELIESDEAFRMRPEALEAAIKRDRALGALPCAVTATLGTTSTASVDPLPQIAEIAQREKMWLHVDAAYAGSATIEPSLRWLWDGIEAADSIVVNPHKWLFTPIDCSVLYTRKPDVLRQTFSLIPEYLKTSDSAEVNYMDYGLQLGRRFRALKLWMVLEHYGTERVCAVIRGHVGCAQRLASELTKRDDIELLAPQSFSVVVFRKVVRNGDSIDEAASEQATSELLERMNASGRLFVSHTRLRNRYGIRVAIGNGATQWEHVARVLEFL
ncbi:MAG TPA: aminotransferase class I/II-fold pyridoxal phosphate-dependent enzyme [Thermoanaerobaculia bacterium]|nr:aminotransferase class I/II-fold pyridoxal phosphate-dependent enzyme [Thermoanaerobaculia bacterium]